MRRSFSLGMDNVNTKYVLGERIKPGDFLSFFDTDKLEEVKLQVDRVIPSNTDDVTVVFKEMPTKGCRFAKRKKVRVQRV